MNEGAALSRLALFQSLDSDQARCGRAGSYCSSLATSGRLAERKAVAEEASTALYLPGPARLKAEPV